MTFDSGKPDLLGGGIFTLPETAELVEAPQGSVRIWVNGRKGRQQPVIENQLGRVAGKVAINFTNLMELRFVARFVNNGVRLNEIRSIMQEAKDTLAHPHPFATRIVFQTDGKKIVAAITRKHGVELVYEDLKSKNFEMPVVVMPSLKEDVVFDPAGNMVAWYPRKEIAPSVIVHPRFSFGRPTLQESHIPTERLAHAVKIEGSVGVVADQFEVSEDQVSEAVRFQADLRQAA
ncbi:MULTISPECIES: hypothetical protein [unclassified Mesorhizobium]|uniref:hypothetical protein n=1 Tax=unclassified Mesorhizobium TaxID=325217 RepID=UPI000FCC707C|nr:MULTISPECIES: hypothetical protein [unclassified Mesorhizobium]TGP18100.1 hypothetical protein EN874_031070 [Mesorhizobium sp. M1D.F.Ca.ET.231.01.1.1]TGP25401.1 hypothetical protein EN877_30325 [Mesorhizobium sp. M1D.F.Ca.ET.234.01.1.1]TGS37868.1 hypothetical protein EN827_30630 [Mesorhizobium sp. M1D.F.Ca.ET.184.01.1.1]TGS58221.1 hypothetical protein EN826_030605 [Mesorhizobium sp. M1D.F.Ca.ET.183.01.1.1]